MGQIFSTFQQLPEHTQTVTLDDEQFRATLIYRERLTAWYLDLRTLDEEDIALGRRVSVEWGPLVGLTPENAPEGFIYVRGPDPYRREDLGSDVLIIRYDLSEIPEPEPDPDPSTVVFLP